MDKFYESRNETYIFHNMKEDHLYIFNPEKKSIYEQGFEPLSSLCKYVSIKLSDSVFSFKELKLIRPTDEHLLNNNTFKYIPPFYNLFIDKEGQVWIYSFILFFYTLQNKDILYCSFIDAYDFINKLGLFNDINVIEAYRRNNYFQFFKIAMGEITCVATSDLQQIFYILENERGAISNLQKGSIRFLLDCILYYQ